LAAIRACPRRFTVPVLDPEARSARASLAAKIRHHGAAADITTETAELERARIDRLIDESVAAAPRMTAEQADRMRRQFRDAPADGGASG
jgi:hypothetical protein